MVLMVIFPIEKKKLFLIFKIMNILIIFKEVLHF